MNQCNDVVSPVGENRSVLRYFITDRRVFGGLEPLFEAVVRQIEAGIELIQIREKDLEVGELARFTKAVMERRGGRETRILINGRIDLARALGADGVHLPASASPVREPGLLVIRSCHSLEEVRVADADYVTFSPVFKSPGKGPAVGIEALHEACGLGIPVIALGGITWENAGECIAAGAAGIAGIRLFQS